jgi:PH (Pleckstrin Homology) domain-containing protein
MIDFQKSAVFKLKPIDNSKARDEFSQFLIDGEVIVGTFKTVRDQVVFTNKRIIAANVQGITGSKVDYTSIPFSKIQTFSIETSGTLDLDCEIQVYISAVGKVSFEIKGSFDIVKFNKIISGYVLG